MPRPKSSATGLAKIQADVLQAIADSDGYFPHRLTVERAADELAEIETRFSGITDDPEGDYYREIGAALDKLRRSLNDKRRP